MVQGFNFKVGLGLTEHDSQSQSHKLHNILWTRKHSCNARVTRDSSACRPVKTLRWKTKLSRKPHPKTKHHVDRSPNRLRSYGHFCISKMAISRHLGFLKLDSCTIRSADHENTTLEPNIMSLGCIQPELCYFKYL